MRAGPVYRDSLSLRLASHNFSSSLRLNSLLQNLHLDDAFVLVMLTSLVEIEADLLPLHNHDPVYIPALKSMLTMGHFIIFNTTNSLGCTERKVGQLLRRCQSDKGKVTICLYFPLYEPETLQFIGSPKVLPRAINDMSCVNVVELVNVSRVADISVSKVIGIAFIFLASDITSSTYYIQGMADAYVTRFKFSPVLNELVVLSSFYAFPDFDAEYNARWSECCARAIFSGICDLRQELWRFLCRYGQSQGHHPKTLIKQTISQTFSFYIANYLVQLGISPQFCIITDQERRIHSSLLYRTVRAPTSYSFFNLDTEAKIEFLGKIIGDFSLVGIRARKPKLDLELGLKINDALNMTSKMGVYLSCTKIRIKVCAFKHLVGDATQHEWLSKQLPSTATPQYATVSNDTVRINSRFDYNGSLFKVVAVDNNEQCLAVCLWGQQVGIQLTFPLELVSGLVKRKRNT